MPPAYVVVEACDRAAVNGRLCTKINNHFCQSIMLASLHHGVFIAGVKHLISIYDYGEDHPAPA